MGFPVKIFPSSNSMIFGFLQVTQIWRPKSSLKSPPERPKVLVADLPTPRCRASPRSTAQGEWWICDMIWWYDDDMMPSFILLLSLLLLLLLLLSLLLYIYIYIYLFSYLFICIVTYHYFRIGMCSDSMDKGQRWRYRYGMIWRDIHIKAEKKASPAVTMIPRFKNHQLHTCKRWVSIRRVDTSVSTADFASQKWTSQDAPATMHTLQRCFPNFLAPKCRNTCSCKGSAMSLCRLLLLWLVSANVNQSCLYAV